MSKEEIKSSKFLSLVLRHQPETIGISLDEYGWTDTQLLIEKMNQRGFNIDLNALKHIVETNSKKRFAFNETFDKIRANQGHSVDVELGYISKKPPAILYHGTGEKSVNAILETGLEKRERNQVHLSADIETAIKVGQRHGKPFVFEVLAGQMFYDNFEFFISDNGVWLTDNVPAKYLKQKDEII
jgi:putative RNA 2'-phosphotransferase